MSPHIGRNLSHREVVTPSPTGMSICATGGGVPILRNDLQLRRPFPTGATSFPPPPLRRIYFSPDIPWPFYYWPSGYRPGTRAIRNPIAIPRPTGRTPSKDRNPARRLLGPIRRFSPNSAPRLGAQTRPRPGGDHLFRATLYPIAGYFCA